MSELIVKLNLDYQDESGQFIDSSGNDYSVTTDSDTAPTLVDDSQFFSVASFDGTDDFISLPDASTLNLTSNSFSVEAWVYIADSISDITSSGDLTILGSLGSGTGNVLQLAIRNGNPFMGFSGIETTASDTTLIPGTWYHLAWVYDAEAKTQTIYLNGAMIAQGTDKEGFTGTGALRVGQWNTGPTFFDGKMAMLRIYTGVQSATDIKRDMYQDNPSYTFNSTYPIDFNLFDKDEANTLYIEDDPADQVLTLEIYNHASETITWEGSDSVSSSNYHFALKFRPQTLAEESLSGDSSIALSETSAASWQLLLESDENERDVVYLLSTNDSTLAPGETLSIEWENVGASGSQGARGTQVELVTDNITYSTDPDTVLQFNRVNHLSVINHRGEDDIPLHVGFVGSNTVLNDGSAPDQTVPQLVLRLTNTNTNTSSTQGNDVNFLLKDDDADTSKIIINFDTDTENNSAENVWALGSSSLVGAIEITPPDNWTVEFVGGDVPEW
ncbi:MAG: LamG domain-containing protein, partial [Moorea sp. SIO3G5]|nr:LamG domain-containing protein [Moorena sp. SIO3G5]